MTTSAERDVPAAASLFGAADAVAEAAASGLSFASLPGNTAKIRLVLDLARQVAAAERVRILDVGAGGRYVPFNLWEPFLPFAERIDLVGIDVDHLDATARRAAEIGFPVELRPGGVETILGTFGPRSFDAVASTQVLEHLRDWRGGVAAMTQALRPGGMLYITCDSGDRSLGPGRKLRLAGKCTYARIAQSAPALRRGASGVLSGDWEKAPTLSELREHVTTLGLEVEQVRHYGLEDLKAASNGLDVRARLLWLAIEEEMECDPAVSTLLYLRARLPG